MAEFKYTSLTEQEKLVQARDTLKAKETDHYRLSILTASEPTAQARLPALEEEIANLKKIVAEQEKAVKAEEKADE